MNMTGGIKALFYIFLISSVLFATSLYAHADTQYVSDNIIITMREGMGNEYKIIKTLKTGTPLEVLEEIEQYYRVRTEDGKEGWVLKRYIVADTPKQIVITNLKAQIEQMKKSIENLKNESDTLKKELASSQNSYKENTKDLEKTIGEKDSEVSSITNQLKDMTNKYNKLIEDSGNVAKIVVERDLLQEENSRLSREKNDLMQKNERLFERNAVYWFLAGGGVFFFGWMSGKLSRKKKRYY